MSHSLGHREVYMAIDTDDPTERTDRIAPVCLNAVARSVAIHRTDCYVQNTCRRLIELANQSQRDIKIEEVVVGEFLAVDDCRGRQIRPSSRSSNENASPWCGFSP